VAWALAYAHGQGLVHRDVKPDNILLEHASGRVMVADFGIAAAIDEVSEDQVAGTPEFMSPEQILDRGCDTRSDIYSLGATAYYAFSGRYVFEGKTPTEVMARHVSEPPAPLGSLGLPVPRKVAALVDRCLAKDPAQRIATAQLFAEQLGVAIEQRRELPMALRAFVRRTARLDGGGTLAGAAVLSVAVTSAAQVWGPAAAMGTLAAGLLAPLAYFIKSARQISMLGFTHRDLPAAFQAEIEQTEDEMSHAVSGPPSIVERWLPRAVRISGLLLGLGIAGSLLVVEWQVSPQSSVEMLALHQLVWRVATSTFGYGAMGFALSVLALVGLGQRRKDIDTAFWARLWSGRVGRLAFAVGRKLVGTRAIGAAQTHRATELSLGIAAEQLFEALPKRTRQPLGDVPAVLRRLQEDATLMRARFEELQEALALHGDMPGTEAYQELCGIRDATQARLADAVAALETIRLDLLRLHAGADAVSSLTTHLGLAAEVSAEVQRLVSARADVDLFLSYPRERAVTPV
jgi:serine/threonine-protein kinase